MKTGITQKTTERFLIGPGAVYSGFTNPSTPGTLLGATIGGNVVNIAREFYVPSLDGALGPVKGSRRLISEIPSVTANLTEITKANLLLALAGTSATVSGSHDLIVSDGAISAGNYLSNVAIVGEKSGTTHPVCFVVKQALSTEPVEINLGTGKDDDVVLQTVFTGHYLPESPGVPPYEIWSPTEA